MQSAVARPDRSTLEAMAAFLKTHLIKTEQLRSGETMRALAETAVRFNESRWFWTDDNAKAAELLCEPGLYDADPDAANAAIDFVLRMSQGAVIQRRGGPAELRVVRNDPADIRVETAFFIIEGDLTRGVLRHALRFNDGRTAGVAAHTGDVIDYRVDGRLVTRAIGQMITATAVAVEERAVVLSVTSTLRGDPVRGRVDGIPLLGHLTYAYRIDADRPSIAVTVTLDPAPGVSLSDVVLTTALAGLAATPRVRFRALAIRADGIDRFVRAIPPQRSVLHRGPAAYSAVVQEGGSPGFAYTLHVLHRDGDRLDAVVGEGTGGALSTVVNRYRIDDVTPGTPVVLREERMLTGGGYTDALDHYAAIMRDAAGGGEADPTMTYDIGAELNAVAVHLLFARSRRYAAAPPAGRLDALTTWYDRHVERYFAFIRPDAPDALDRVFTRGIAFTVMSLDCMVRATGHARYRALLDAGVDLLFRLARRRRFSLDPSAVRFGDAWSPLGRFLDLHAACLLALARAAWHGDPDGAIGRTIHAAVRGIESYAGLVKLGPTHRERYTGLAIRNRLGWRTHVDTGFWLFKLGLVLRALHAVEGAADARVIAMSVLESQRLRQRLARAEGQIMAASRWHGTMLEVPTSPIAGETNSETQPWVALGLVPAVDEQIVTCGIEHLRPRKR